MKLTIDFTNKTIKIEEPTLLKDLIKQLETLPDWQDYSAISSNTVYHVPWLSNLTTYYPQEFKTTVDEINLK